MFAKLLIIAILASLSCNVSALRCYVCEGCNDPFTGDSSYERTCTAGMPFGKASEKLYNEILSKTNSKAIGSACLKVKEDETGIVVRSCTPAVDGIDVCETMEALNPNLTFDCEVCDEDLCNSNVMYTGNILLIVTLIYTMFLFL